MGRPGSFGEEILVIGILSSDKEKEAACLLALEKEYGIPENLTAGEATRALFERFHPDRIWIWFALIGVASMIGLIVYDRVFVRGKSA